MPYLNKDWNKPKKWTELRQSLRRFKGVSAAEIEHVKTLAHRVPDLYQYREAIDQLAKYVIEWPRYVDPDDDLSDLADYWADYRAAILQRVTGVRAATLRATGKIAREVYLGFLKQIPSSRIAYPESAQPLVCEGRGGPDDYYTYAAEDTIQFPLIKMPEAAFGAVQRWMAIPHEVGHDLYTVVDGLEKEANAALDKRMRKAVQDGEVVLPSVTIDLNPEISYKKTYTAAQFLSRVWTAWANEAQADVIGVLSCGPAAVVEIQQIFGFDPEDAWEVDLSGSQVKEGPETHPTTYVRQQLSLSALKAIGGHAALVKEIEARTKAVRKTATEIVWSWYDQPLVTLPMDPWLKSAEIAAETLVHGKLKALGNKSYAEALSFETADQKIVDQMIDPLIDGDPRFGELAGASPLHSLAAAIFAFEKAPDRNSVISDTVLHFI